MLGPVGSALDYAHARDVVHRDVKPSNVLLARDGTPVLSDFGLARMMMGTTPRLTRTGAVVGTPEYMAPEQAMGEEATAASDRYALAVIAYEMILGSVPFSSDTPLATLLAHAHKPLPLPREKDPSIPPALEEVLLKGLAKDPEQRYATCREFIAALEAAGAARPAVPAPLAAAPVITPASAAPTVSPAAPPAEAVKRAGIPRAAIIGLAAVALVVVAAVTATATGIIGGRGDRARVASELQRPAGDYRGLLQWTASIDASGIHAPTHTGGAEVRITSGAVECAVTQQGGAGAAGIGRSASAPFYVEMDVSAQGQPAFVFTWGVRVSPAGNHQLRVESVAGGDGRLRFAWLPATGTGTYGAPVGLSDPVTIKDWTSGRTITLAVAAKADAYIVFVDGRAVTSARDDRIPASTPATTPGFGCGGATGSARITAMRMYQLLTP